MPRSRSRSMLSSTWALISRSERPPQRWIRRSASVDLPWSMWAMIEKLRIFCIEETEWVGICTGRQPERNARRERAALAKHGRHRAFLGPIIVPFRRHYTLNFPESFAPQRIRANAVRFANKEAPRVPARRTCGKPRGAGREPPAGGAPVIGYRDQRPLVRRQMPESTASAAGRLCVSWISKSAR